MTTTARLARIGMPPDRQAKRIRGRRVARGAARAEVARAATNATYDCESDHLAPVPRAPR